VFERSFRAGVQGLRGVFSGPVSRRCRAVPRAGAVVFLWRSRVRFGPVDPGVGRLHWGRLSRRLGPVNSLKQACGTQRSPFLWDVQDQSIWWSPVRVGSERFRSPSACWIQQSLVSRGVSHSRARVGMGCSWAVALEGGARRFLLLWVRDRWSAPGVGAGEPYPDTAAAHQGHAPRG
jgi:hypothetical protein